MRPTSGSVRKKRRVAVFLLCAGLIGVICFSAGIAIYVYRNWRDASYYESLAGSFAHEETRE